MLSSLDKSEEGRLGARDMTGELKVDRRCKLARDKELGGCPSYEMTNRQAEFINEISREQVAEQCRATLAENPPWLAVVDAEERAKAWVLDSGGDLKVFDGAVRDLRR